MAEILSKSSGLPLIFRDFKLSGSWFNLCPGFPSTIWRALTVTGTNGRSTGLKWFWRMKWKRNILSYLHVPRCSDGRLHCPHTQLDVFMAETERSVKPMFFAPAGPFSSYGRYHTERPSLRSPCSRGEQGGEPFRGIVFYPTSAYYQRVHLGSWLVTGRHGHERGPCSSQRL